MCYDYANLHNLSDISAYRNHNVQLCKMQNPEKYIRLKFLGSVYYLHYINRYVYDSVVNSILNRTFKIRKV